MNNNGWWNIDLEGKPDFEKSIERIYAWYEGEIIDRVPVSFQFSQVEHSKDSSPQKLHWGSLKERWFDEEYQVSSFLESINNRRFIGETFPVFNRLKKRDCSLSLV